MKKASVLIIILILASSIFLLGFGSKKSTLPNYYYKVYLNDELLGTIKDKVKLEKYIDKKGESIKRKYDVSKVYAPKGLKIQKVTTYSKSLDSISKIYKKIEDKAPFTIKGYEFNIKKEVTEDDKKKIEKIKINVLNKSVFKEAVDSLINIYVGKDKYKAYLNDNQVKIESTGEKLENVYIEEDITFKETYIPSDETIYTTSGELSKFLLFGEDSKTSFYEVRAGDTIEDVAFNNKISTDELLISNESLTSSNNLLYPGQKLVIEETAPQLNIVTESYVIKDVESGYPTEEKYDNSMLLGDEKVTREGEKGLVRVTQKEKKINGILTFVAPQGKEVLKEPVSKIVVRGSKYVSGVGSLTNWGWPTDSGWTMSSGYQYRYSPVGRGRELHTGLDISGTGHGSKIYATNNGVVMTAEYHYSYGYHVVINHNNGYMTVYAHMSRMAVRPGQTVERGQVIGYVGSTGDSTGPHVHYEVWKGKKWNHINPSVLYPGGYR